MAVQSWWDRSAIEQPFFRPTLLGPLEYVSGGTAQVTDVATAKAWSRITQSEQDSVVDGLIEAATRYVERESDRMLRPTTFNVPVMRFWSGVLKLPKPPLASVTSIKYFDTASVEQTVDSSIYVVRTPWSQPGYVERAPYQVWPVHEWRHFPVTVQFVCGYATAADVPQTYKQAMYLLIGHWFYNREAMVNGSLPQEIAMGVSSLIQSESWGSYS